MSSEWPYKYVKVIFDKGAETIQLRKDDLFNKGCWNDGYPQAPKWTSA